MVPARAARWWRPLLVALALMSCDGPGSADEIPDGAAEEPVATPAPIAHVTPVVPRAAAVRPAAPAAPRVPVVDAEADARARADEELAAYEASWPLHGVCYHYLGQIRARPDGASRIVGYMRRGSRFRARESLRGPGCARGWSEVEGGGYVCRAEGFQIGQAPQTFEPSPAPPSLADALPYAYAHVGREDAPEYWRLPSVQEEADAQALMATLRERAAAAAARATAPDEPANPDLEAPPGLVEVTGAAPTTTRGAPAIATDTALTLPAFFRQRLQRGFYVSLDAEVDDGGRQFFRTIRGAYVPADAMTPAEPPSMRGVVLSGAFQPPLGFVYRRGASTLSRDSATGVLRESGTAEYHHPMLLADEIIERRGSPYRVARDGTIVRETTLRLIVPIARPANIGAEDRWIHVDLSDQTLVAYEGDRAVFATLVSTGRVGFETPIGTYRIQSKHVSTTMDDPDSPTEAYSIEDVPWTMYFEGSYALHAAFWHDNFGRVRSHGCVNLAPADARWLFEWTGPALPPGWHGIITTPRAPGTWVHITE